MLHKGMAEALFFRKSPHTKLWSCVSGIINSLIPRHSSTSQIAEPIAHIEDSTLAVRYFGANLQQVKMASRASASDCSVSHPVAKSGRKEGGSKQSSKHFKAGRSSSRGSKAASKDEERRHKVLSKICDKAASQEAPLTALSSVTRTTS